MSNSGSEDEMDLVEEEEEEFFESQSSSEEEDSDNDQEIFPRDLPIRHQYLGNTEEIRGRTVMFEGEVIKIPILAHCNEMRVTLVPGQTLPLTFFENAEQLVAQAALASNKIMGILHRPVPPSMVGTANKSKMYGTIAEIQEADNFAEQRYISLIAKGRQRFQVKSASRNEVGVEEAFVEILPEIKLADALLEHRLPVIQRLDYSHAVTSPKSSDELKKLKRRTQIRKRNAMCTPWPSWVYDMYDANLLACKLQAEIISVFQQEIEDLHIPKSPEDLSFWSALNLPLPRLTRLNILTLHTSNQRLRHLLAATTETLKTKFLKCVSCLRTLTSMKNMFAMSVEGPQGTFVNPGGYVHEMITIREIQGASITGSPSEEYSWFPGYSWQIIMCGRCGRHLGWKFKAVRGSLKPRKFYGLTRGAILTEPMNGVNDVETPFVI